MDDGWLESRGGLAMLTDNQPRDFITSMLKRYPKLWGIVNVGDRPFEPSDGQCQRIASPPWCMSATDIGRDHYPLCHHYYHGTPPNTQHLTSNTRHPAAAAGVAVVGGVRHEPLQRPPRTPSSTRRLGSPSRRPEAKHREAALFWDAIGGGEEEGGHNRRVWTVNTQYTSVSLHPRNRPTKDSGSPKDNYNINNNSRTRTNRNYYNSNSPPPVAMLPLGPKKGPEFGAWPSMQRSSLSGRKPYISVPVPLISHLKPTCSVTEGPTRMRRGPTFSCAVAWTQGGWSHWSHPSSVTVSFLNV